MSRFSVVSKGRVVPQWTSTTARCTPITNPLHWRRSLPDALMVLPGAGAVACPWAS